MAILKQTAMRGKYGLVIVKNGDGTFNREYKITAQELIAWQAAGKYSVSTHVGVTQSEWESSNTILLGKDYETGDMRLYPDGTIRMKYGETLVNGHFVEDFCLLKPGDYTGTAPNISVSKAVLDTLSYGLPGREVAVNSKITSIIGGVVETK